VLEWRKNAVVLGLQREQRLWWLVCRIFGVDLLSEEVVVQW
jgi:hypothetical protein